MTDTFKIPVADVDRGEVHKEWPLSLDWLTWAFDATEATATGNPGRLTVTVSRSGKEYVVLGQISAEVLLPCARTLEPTLFELNPSLTLLLRRAPVSKSAQPRARAASRSERHRTRAQKKEDSDMPLSDEDAASDTFSGESIVLDEFVREQLLLEFPMFPLRSDLRSAPSAAIGPAPQTPAARAAGGEPTEQHLDPRLAPLLDIAKKLKKSTQD